VSDWTVIYWDLQCGKVDRVVTSYTTDPRFVSGIFMLKEMRCIIFSLLGFQINDFNRMLAFSMTRFVIINKPLKLKLIGGSFELLRHQQFILKLQNCNFCILKYNVKSSVLGYNYVDYFVLGTPTKNRILTTKSDSNIFPCEGFNLIPSTIVPSG